MNRDILRRVGFPTIAQTLLVAFLAVPVGAIAPTPPHGLRLFLADSGESDGTFEPRLAPHSPSTRLEKTTDSYSSNHRWWGSGPGKNFTLPDNPTLTLVVDIPENARPTGSPFKPREKPPGAYYLDVRLRLGPWTFSKESVTVATPGSHRLEVSFDGLSLPRDLRADTSVELVATFYASAPLGGPHVAYVLESSVEPSVLFLPGQPRDEAIDHPPFAFALPFERELSPTGTYDFFEEFWLRTTAPGWIRIAPQDWDYWSAGYASFTGFYMSVQVWRPDAVAWALDHPEDPIRWNNYEGHIWAFPDPGNVFNAFDVYYGGTGLWRVWVTVHDDAPAVGSLRLAGHPYGG